MQHLLIVVVIMLITGLSYTVVKWPGGLHMTFSQHVIATRWSKIYYASLFLVTLPLFVWFIGSWFVPQKQLPGTFLWFTCVAALFQLACTWFPETGGWRTAVHRVLTGVSGVAMLPLVHTSYNLKHFNVCKILCMGRIRSHDHITSNRSKQAKGLQVGTAIASWILRNFFCRTTSRNVPVATPQ